MRGAPFVLFVVAAAVAGVVFQHGVGDVPVRYQLNRAVVVAQLFLGQNVRTVAVDLPVDADDLLHDAGDRADVVRHHDDRHAGVQFMQRAVKLLLEFVVHEIRGFVQDQQPRVRDHGPGQQRPLHLPARHLADGAAGRVGDSRCRKQFHRSGTVLLRVAGAESAAALLLAACTPEQPAGENTFYVSIPPLRSIVEGIVGDDFKIEVLVPPGASPETFEPTPRQFVELNKAQLIFNVGLIDFETTLLGKVGDQAKVVNLSRGIDLIAGSCSHGHHGHDHGHAHGVDPHVWTSPKALQTMAANAYEAIRNAYPDSVKYEAGYNRLRSTLKELDIRTAEKIARSGVKYFIVYHPALTYYARDYGLRQVAIEADGKEPSAKQLTAVIRQAREDGVRRIFYQNQFPASTVEIIARDIVGAQTQPHGQAHQPVGADTPQEHREPRHRDLCLGNADGRRTPRLGREHAGKFHEKTGEKQRPDKISGIDQHPI